MLTIRLSMLAEGCCCNLNASACFVLLARNSLQCILIPQLDCQLSVRVTTSTAAVCAEWLKKRQGAKSLAQCSHHITVYMASNMRLGQHQALPLTSSTWSAVHFLTAIVVALQSAV